MRIFIEPMEPLLFRSGQPFEAGESNYAESLFPPTPETLQGALRAAIASHWGSAQTPPIYDARTLFAARSLLELIGDRTSYGRLRITSLTLGRALEGGHVERLFPPPASILKATLKKKGSDDPDDEREELLTVRPVDDVSSVSPLVETNMPDVDGHAYTLLYPTLPSDWKIAEKAEPLRYWLTWDSLRAFLTGDNVILGDTVSPDQIYGFESRLGIGMNSSTQVTREGFLYQVRMVRMKPGYGFVMDIAFGDIQNSQCQHPIQEALREPGDTLKLPNEGWIILGGEQRAARFRVLRADECAPENTISSNSGKRNLLYFLTPAYFKNGWLSENLPAFVGGKARLVSASVERYQPIGGWELEPGTAGGKAKTTRRCIPAGSVYYFDQSVSVNCPVTEYGWQIGYGITYTGEW